MEILENPIRPYAWGSRTLIAQALGRPPSSQPEAELWLGAHPSAPSRVRGQDLDEWIAQDPEAALGSQCRETFGDHLPFLAKFLAADSPLSLQVHPTMEQAAAGYAAEEAAGISLTAAERNYKDPYHKPEMILALTDFDALCGFRPLAQTHQVFAALDSASASLWSQARSILAAGEDEQVTFRRLFETLLRTQEAPEAIAQLRDLADRELSLPPHLASSVSAAARIGAHYPHDPGVLVALLLHYVRLAPGEAIALPAGHVHAYLNGLGFEVMAASDNVLRGGLTPKHVDIAELLRVVSFRSLPLPRINPECVEEGYDIFRPDVDEFLLQRVRVTPGQQRSIPQNGPLILAVLEGSIRVSGAGGSVNLERGQSIFVPASEAPTRVEGLETATIIGVTTNSATRV